MGIMHLVRKARAWGVWMWRRAASRESTAFCQTTAVAVMMHSSVLLELVTERRLIGRIESEMMCLTLHPNQ